MLGYPLPSIRHNICLTNDSRTRNGLPNTRCDGRIVRRKYWAELTRLEGRRSACIVLEGSSGRRGALGAGAEAVRDVRRLMDVD